MILLLLTLPLTGCAAPLASQGAPAMTALRGQLNVPRDEPTVRTVGYQDDGSAASAAAGPRDDGPSTLQAAGAGITAPFQHAYQRLTGTARDPEQARQAYAEAEQRYREALRLRDGAEASAGSVGAVDASAARQQFAAASAEFEKASKLWPGSPLEQDALFWAGEASFFADHYPRANHLFELLVKKHPQTAYMDRLNARRFAIAQFWLELDRADPLAFYEVAMFDRQRPWRDVHGHALRVLDRIRLDDPTGRLADDATMAAGNAHLLAGNWLEADRFYSDLRKTFPSSRHQFQAHFLGVQAKLNSYQGHDYAGGPLIESEKLLTQIQRQFPQNAQDEREHLARTWAKLKYLQSEREWTKGQYYDRRQEYRAAALHYREIVEAYGETPFGDRARQRLAAIDDRPATPPQRLAWLVDLFPNQDANQPLLGTTTR